LLGAEIMDDSLSLIDVAYIYVMKKVRRMLISPDTALT